MVDAAPVEFVDLDESRRVFEVNVLGVLSTTRAFLPQIRSSKGRIVNMSSLSALLSLPFLSAYNASKAALESLTDALRRELLTFGVDVVVMQPGTTRTPLWHKAENIDLTAYRRNTPYGNLRRERTNALSWTSHLEILHLTD